jgi:hypothetical protein
MSWKGGKWVIKALLQFKMGQNALIEGNLFENVWANAQTGNAILFAVRNENGNSPWSTIRNIIFRNNIVRNTGTAVAILGKEGPPIGSSGPPKPSIRADNILIENNLFYNINTPPGVGEAHMFKLGDMPTRLTIAHNTLYSYDFSSASSCLIEAFGTEGVGTGFVFRNNLGHIQSYGICGNGMGTPTLSKWFPGAVVEKNVIAGANEATYPPNNYYPPVSAASFAANFVNPSAGDYRLVANSPYRNAATDGTAIGVNMDQLEAALSGVASASAPSAPLNVRIVP